MGGVIAFGDDEDRVTDEWDAGPVGVVGAGGIGLGVAADLALNGFRVVLVDSDPVQAEKALRAIAEAVRCVPMLRPGLPVGPDEVASRIQVSLALTDLSECGLVVENVTERLDVKRRVHRDLDRVLGPTAVVAVNTSSIPIALLGAEVTRPERLIGMHFMNPPYLTSAVEVMRPESTSDAAFERVSRLARKLQKKVIVVGDSPGFVSNRISHLFFNEAARVVDELAVDPAVVDQIFRNCFGHRMGPLETADLIGLDTVVNTLDFLREALNDDRFDACALLRTMVGEGRLGRKARAGFHDYDPIQPSAE